MIIIEFRVRGPIYDLSYFFLIGLIRLLKDGS